MWPRTETGEKKHRKRKRELEISLILKTLSDFLKERSSDRQGEIKILEFGTGDGFQIPYLQKIGRVTATDLYRSETLEKLPTVSFRECSITDTPFQDGEFDLVFSNHVLEHVDNLNQAFEELKRIGAPDCLYAFALPTNLWLLFSIPAQYYRAVRMIWRKVWSFFSPNGKKLPTQKRPHDREEKPLQGIHRLTYYLFPNGHGVHSGFLDCYRAFRIKNWQRLFLDHGFSILKIQPLLLYAPSEWPIVPTTPWFNRFGFCSSVLFLLKKVA